ncbi:hypothetical protein OHS18_42060 [Amycolatopsis sp. NBC_00355]|uniref:hypothetical protein n=1 Tax=Amycolatopsis sp. NBC_00355 TaxID=2975957 RepID=UPI002E256E36
MTAAEMTEHHPTGNSERRGLGGGEAAKDKQAKERLKWADGRAVFRMPETTDEQLDQLRFVRTREDRRAFNIALRGILGQLADPAQREQRLREARTFDERNASRVLIRAIDFVKAKRMDRDELQREFVSTMNFYVFSPIDEDFSDFDRVDLAVESDAGEPLKIEAFSRSDWLLESRPTEEAEAFEIAGVHLLEVQKELGCVVTLDPGFRHEITLPATAEEAA